MAATARGPLRRLLRKARAHRRTVWLASACSVLNKLFDLAPPALIGAAVDVVVSREASLLARLGFATPQSQLWALAVATVAVWGLESLFEYFYAVLWRTLAQTLQHELRVEAYAHIQDLDMAWFADQSRGGLMAVLNDDVNQLERFLDGGANSLLQVLTTVVVVSAAFVAASPAVAALAILPLPFVVWGSFRFQARIAPRYAEVRRRVGLLNAVLANDLEGIAVIKSFTAEEREVARVERASADYQEANRHAIRLSSAFSPLIRMVIVIGFTATLVYGGDLALRGELNVGTYSVLVFLTQRLLWPLTRLGQTFDLYQRAMASTTRILDLLDTPVTIADGGEALDRAAVRGEIAFEDVHFAYPGREPLFRGLSLRVPAGARVGIVGATGAGKSSLVRLLLRFHEPQGGRILLDGKPIDSLRLADLRGAVALVSQTVFVFPGSVRENIAYGRPEASDDEIEAAARLAEAHDFIAALPQGYDTQVGEQGQKLSGGQRQRLSLARAVLKDAPVLVLDEATSAVDNETEAAIQRSMQRIAAGRTTLVIAHRLSTLRGSDLIFVLDRGEVVEQGTHEELLARDGIYRRLWAVQTGEVLAAPAG
ncbi:MAG: ABC transporter ATP-binding protein [Planctomycetota bacterium]|nr:MAG: ABC transporter ATP-binding protein [Planctomycetota bacterium]